MNHSAVIATKTRQQIWGEFLKCQSRDLLEWMLHQQIMFRLPEFRVAQIRQRRPQYQLGKKGNKKIVCYKSVCCPTNLWWPFNVLFSFSWLPLQKNTSYSIFFYLQIDFMDLSNFTAEIINENFTNKCLETEHFPCTSFPHFLNS